MNKTDKQIDRLETAGKVFSIGYIVTATLNGILGCLAAVLG